MDQKLRQDAALRAKLGVAAVAAASVPPSPSWLSPDYHHHHPTRTPTVPTPSNTNFGNSSSISYSYNHPLPHKPSTSIHSTKNNTFHAQPQPQQHPVNDSSTETEDFASKARQEWQQYGKNTTQVLEDLRYGRYCPDRPTTAATTHNLHWKIGKVIRAEERVDITGAQYSTYIIHIWDRCSQPVATTSTPATTHDSSNLSSITVIERRYSEFCKLYNSLVSVENGTGKHHHQHQPRTDNLSMFLSYPDWYDAIQSIFPNKHWTGRIGNWSPAKYIAPQQYHNTIQERIQAFDAWFVYVLYAYNVYPQQVQQQQTTSYLVPFLSEQQNSIVHDYITNPSPPPPYMIRNSTSRSNGSSPSGGNHGSSSSITETATSTAPTTSTILQYHNPVTFTLSSAIRQATTTIQIMTQQVQNQSTSTVTSTPTTIPIDLLHIATGIAFLTVAKIGMIVSGRVGTGVFIAKRPSSTATTIATEHHASSVSSTAWSAPVAVGTIGLGWGAVVGGDVTHYMIVFTTDEAVRDFGRNHTVHLGTELGISIGPAGMAASQQIQSKSKNILEYHSTYAYAISSGLFLGVTLEGSMISIRHDVNAKFYGQTNISVMELLQSPGVPAAEPLYDALDVAIRQEIPENAIFKVSRYIQRDDDEGSSTKR